MEVEKRMKITFMLNEVTVLQRICEQARWAINHRHNAELSEEQMGQMVEMIEEIIKL